MTAKCEDYPGQQFYHEHNPRIRRAEENFMTKPKQAGVVIPVPQKPSVGRIVHYIKLRRDDDVSSSNSNSGTCMAALITGTYEGTEEVADLTVFPRVAQPIILREVKHSEEKNTDSWHWPERV